MTKKEMQKMVNAEAEKKWDEAVVNMAEKIASDGGWKPNGIEFYAEKLDYCSAYVLDFGNVKFLRSYNTVIACITSDGDLIDMLRKVYGYTATSAKHIAKFRRYKTGKELTWREV